MVEVAYREYRPAGYTDDLGIIADRNQWIQAQPEGWHVYFDHKLWIEIRNWLDDNNIYHETYFNSVVLFYESDVVLFKLRWQ